MRRVLAEFQLSALRSRFLRVENSRFLSSIDLCTIRTGYFRISTHAFFSPETGSRVSITVRMKKLTPTLLAWLILTGSYRINNKTSGLTRANSAVSVQTVNSFIFILKQFSLANEDSIWSARFRVPGQRSSDSELCHLFSSCKRNDTLAPLLFFIRFITFCIIYLQWTGDSCL